MAKNNNNLVFNDQYTIGYWTEYANTFADNNIEGDIKQEKSVIIQVSGAQQLSAVPNQARINLSSKVYGFGEGKQYKILDFETNSHPYRVFRSHEYKELKTNFRYTNPQRIIKLYNNSSFAFDGKQLGTPIIIDSQVPQPPDYILALNSKLTSQWSTDKIYGTNNTKQRKYFASQSFATYQDDFFKLYPPFSYNFVDSFVNKIWANVKLSESVALTQTSYDKFSELSKWFSDEAKEDIPHGNHYGLSILPITTSLAEFGSTNPTASARTYYRINSVTKGPVHIGLGFVSAHTGINIVSSYHEATNNSNKFYLDVVRNPTESYFTSMGSVTTRNFVFYETGSQQNLCQEWLYSYPNEHRFKSLERFIKPKRLGKPSWGTYENAKYSTQGWVIPENLTEKDYLGLINDLKLGTLFWKFDSGICKEMYFPPNNINLTSVTLPVTSGFNIVGQKGINSFTYAVGEVLSPTIIMADFVGTPKEYSYSEPISASSGFIQTKYPMYPKLNDMYDTANLNMQFSLSFTPTYPKINDLYKSFYGFGDGIVTNLSEYVTDSSGRWSVQKVYDGDEYAHRKQFIWGKDKMPAFKQSYKFLHSMTYANVPLPIDEMPVTFSAYTGSNPSNQVYYPVEKEVLNIDKMVDLWPPNGGGYSGPVYEKPLWWEGPQVVAGPILRGYKYGLFDCLPRVPTSVYRRDKFGQVRDLLEQRLFYATKYTETLSEVYGVTTRFVTGSYDDSVWKEYDSWVLGDPEPQNKMDAGLYEIHSRVGKPFNESGWV